MKKSLQRMVHLINNTNWFNLRVGIISLVLIILAGSNLAWVHLSEPHPGRVESVLAQLVLTPTAMPAFHASPTQTLLPPEYLQNSGQTTGVILVAMVMVLIVVGGVLYTLINERYKIK